MSLPKLSSDSTVMKEGKRVPSRGKRRSPRTQAPETLPSHRSAYVNNDDINQPQLRAHDSFYKAHNFAIYGAQITDASQTTNVYSEATGLEILRRNMATGAMHNSRDRFDPPKCDEDTRLEVINEIMDWIKDTTTPTGILCMTGAAGAGKSALEQTVAEMCEKEGILAASFFFSSQDPSRNDESRFVATLVYQIAQSINEVRSAIMQAVERDPSIFERSLDTQMKALVVNPLQQAAATLQPPQRPWPHAILIDGLDECKGEGHQAHILRSIHSCIIDNNLPFRIFIASRPEYAIRTSLEEQGHLFSVAYHIILDNKYNPDADIRRYLWRRLRDIGLKSNDPRAPPDSWPSKANVEKLVDNASGQFIYVATVVKFVSERRRSPVDLLQLVMTWTPASNTAQNPFAALDALYSNILIAAQEAFQAFTDDRLAIVRLVHKIYTLQSITNRGITGLIEPEQYDGFLCLQIGETLRMVSDLHSLLYFKPVTVGDNRAGPTFHHKSFMDFLSSPKRALSLFIPSTTINSELLVTSLRHIKGASPDDFQQVVIDFGNLTNLSLSIIHCPTFLSSSSLDNQIVDELDGAFNSGGWGMLTSSVERAGIALYGSVLPKIQENLYKKYGPSPGRRWQRHLDNFSKLQAIIANYETRSELGLDEDGLHEDHEDHTSDSFWARVSMCLSC